MARPLRIEFPGAVYHVTSRGNARGMIFDGDDDRELFFSILTKIVQRYRWLCHAYCLMGNHYHLLIETPEGNLSRGMRHLNGIYTQAFNRCRGRSGHLFQGRYKAILVEKESYLLELCRYIVLNPVAANMVEAPEAWPWSSFLPTAGLAPAPDLLTTDWLLAQFAPRPEEARKRYAAFVYDGLGRLSPWEELRGGVLLGGEEFVEGFQQRLAEKGGEDEVPRGQRLACRPLLEDLFGPDMDREKRAASALEAHGDWGYTLKEIGAFLGLHYATVSKMVNRAG